MRDAEVDSSKEGISAHRCTRSFTGNCAMQGAPPCMAVAVKPPYSAGVTLSGCPSKALRICKISCRENGLPRNAFAASAPPVRNAEEEPMPRVLGISE